MRWLLRLYPRTWRNRYELEQRDLLERSPSGFAARFDLIRGAADAHLHPELLGGDRQPWTHRLPGITTISAGLLWSWFFVNAWLIGPDGEWGSAAGIAVVLMILSVPGDYLGGYKRHIPLLIGAVVGVAVLARLLPWSFTDGRVNVALGVVGYLLVGASVMAAVAIRAGIGAPMRWVMAAVGLVVPAGVAIGVMGGFGPNDPGGAAAMVVALVPYGVTWAIIGLRMTIRGSPTISDAPASSLQREVPAG